MELGQVVVRNLPLVVPKRVDKGVLRLDLSSLMQHVLEEILEGVLDKILDEVHLKEVLKRIPVATFREGLEEVPERVDLLLLLPLPGNREEEEVEKESAVKERKKLERTFFSPIILLLLKLPVNVMLFCSVQSMSIK